MGNEQSEPPNLPPPKHTKFDIQGTTWRYKKTIGTGGFGDVYAVEQKQQVVALKWIAVQQGDSVRLASARNELHMVARIKAAQENRRAISAPGLAFVVRFLGTTEQKSGGMVEFGILMELLEGETVWTWLSKEDRPLQHKLQVVHQAALAIAAMHAMGLTNRDVKTENLVFVKPYDGHAVGGQPPVVKLLDVGSATDQVLWVSTADREAIRESIKRSTTPSYRAPEMIHLSQGVCIDTKVDVWALGCVLYGCLFRQAPFPDGNLAIASGRFVEPPVLPAAATPNTATMALLKAMLTVDPADRPDIGAVVKQLEAMLGNRLKSHIWFERASQEYVAAHPELAEARKKPKKKKKKKHKRKRSSRIEAVAAVAPPAEAFISADAFSAFQFEDGPIAEAKDQVAPPSPVAAFDAFGDESEAKEEAQEFAEDPFADPPAPFTSGDDDDDDEEEEAHGVLAGEAAADPFADDAPKAVGLGEATANVFLEDEREWVPPRVKQSFSPLRRRRGRAKLATTVTKATAKDTPPKAKHVRALILLSWETVMPHDGDEERHFAGVPGLFELLEQRMERAKAAEASTLGFKIISIMHRTLQLGSPAMIIQSLEQALPVLDRIRSQFADTACRLDAVGATSPVVDLVAPYAAFVTKRIRIHAATPLENNMSLGRWLKRAVAQRDGMSACDWMEDPTGTRGSRHPLFGETLSMPADAEDALPLPIRYMMWLVDLGQELVALGDFVFAVGPTQALDGHPTLHLRHHIAVWLLDDVRAICLTAGYWMTCLVLSNRFAAGDLEACEKSLSQFCRRAAGFVETAVHSEWVISRGYQLGFVPQEPVPIRTGASLPLTAFPLASHLGRVGIDNEDLCRQFLTLLAAAKDPKEDVTEEEEEKEKPKADAKPEEEVEEPPPAYEECVGSKSEDESVEEMKDPDANKAESEKAVAAPSFFNFDEVFEPAGERERKVLEKQADLDFALEAMPGAAETVPGTEAPLRSTTSRADAWLSELTRDGGGMEEDDYDQPGSTRASASPVVARTFREIDPNHLTFGAQIGRGQFGGVFRGVLDGTAVAIKKIDAQFVFSKTMEGERKVAEDAARVFASEVTVLAGEVSAHPCIVSFVGAVTQPGQLAIVTELCDFSLFDVLHASCLSPLPVADRLRFAYEIASAMNALHSHGIVHRDLKSANVLLKKSDAGLRALVADFGLSKMIANVPGSMAAPTATGNIGTARWMAPEVATSARYSEKADVFSFGICLWELMELALPFPKLQDVQVALAVSRGDRPPIDASWPPEIVSLIAACWQQEGDRRPSFEQVQTQLERYK